MHYGSYLRADKYLYKVPDQPFDLHKFVFLLIASYKSSVYSYTPMTWNIGNLHTLINGRLACMRGGVKLRLCAIENIWGFCTLPIVTCDR